jgi:hypothetical protein
MKFLPLFCFVLLTTLPGLSSPALAHTEFFSTSFEFNDSGTFSIGDAPLQATFSGGSAQVIGVAAYYHSGTHSWHVPNGGQSTVTFETAADQVDFWFRDTAGAAVSSYRIIDTNEAVIGSGSGTQAFVNVVLTRTGTLSRIARVEFESAGGGDTVVDDFDYAANEEPPAVANLTVSLEEPINGLVHGGIGNLRGWAVSSDGIDRVEVWIDNAFAFEAPYGGSRTDVGAQFPDISNSELSGFSLAYGYSNLSVGQHTITAKAYTILGELAESTSVFDVIAFDKTFIFGTDVVDTTDAVISSNGDEITMENVSIAGTLYDLTLKWRTAEQGFEIIDIR